MGSWKDLGALTARWAGRRATTGTHGERPWEGGRVGRRGRAIGVEGGKGEAEGEPPKGGKIEGRHRHAAHLRQQGNKAHMKG